MTLSVASGVLNAAAGTSGVTISGTGTASLTASGTIAQLNDLLAGALGSTLTYINNSDTPPSTDTLVLSINDNGSTGGGPLSATTSATISIAAVNDVPVNGEPGAQVTNANTPIVFSGANAISLSDVDASSGTAHAERGPWNAKPIEHHGVNTGVGANGSASMSYRGTLANLNAALNGMTYIPANNYSGADTLSITSNDQGSTGSGGALISATTVGITVNAPAPSPVVVVPPPSPPAPAPTPSPGPSSPPAPAPPTPAPPSSPPAPPSGGGSTSTGGSGAVGEPAQPVGIALVVDGTHNWG
jgi:hypothetical protein